MTKPFHKFSFLIIILIIFGCSKTEKQIIISNSKNIEKAFFEYDEVEYYHNNTDNSLLGMNKYYEEFEKNSKDTLEFKILIGNTPESLGDSSFVQKLTKNGFEKINLSKEKQDRLKRIFVEKDRKPEIKAGLKPIFNDILVFRKNGKITGFSKLSFEDLQSRVIGTNSNTFYFPTDIENREIEKILYK